AALKPAIYAIEPPDANLHLVWVASGERVASNFDCARKIFGVNDAARRPILYVLQPLAEILQNLPIGDFDFPSRRHPHNKTGNTVYDQARIALACPQRDRCLLRGDA